MNAPKMLRLAQERKLTLAVSTPEAVVGPARVVTVEDDLCTLRMADSKKMKALMFGEIQSVEVVSSDPRR